MNLTKFVSVLAIAFLAFACAPTLPQKDVDAANAAFADAKAAGADVYAVESFKVASDANDALQNNIAAKEFGKTAELAKVVVEASAKAKADAATGLETVKGEVTTLTTEVAASLDSVKKALDKAVKAKKKGLDAKKAKDAYAALAKSAEDAKASVTANNFADAKVKLVASKEGLEALKKQVE